MTERKAFKRRVRGQMSQTGQTYSQAATQLEADNPARREDVHPASALVVALLRASGLTLDPVAAFGIGGGIGFMYGLFQYRAVPHPLLTLVCQHHPDPWAPAILERTGVAHITTSGKRELIRLLDADRPVILPVAREVIPWFTADATTAREEHVVLALPDGTRARLLDGTGAQATLGKDELVGGYLATRRRHPLIALEDGATLPGDLRPALGAGLRATVAGMTEPVLGNAFDVNFGLRGLRRWAERVADPGADGWARLFASSDVWRTRLIQCINIEYTAPVAGRPLFARLLRQAGYTESAIHFEDSSAAWREITGTAEGGSRDVEGLASLIRTIAEEELRGFETLRGELAKTA